MYGVERSVGSATPKQASQAKKARRSDLGMGTLVHSNPVFTRRSLALTCQIHERAG